MRQALINIGSWLIMKIAAAAEPANNAKSCMESHLWVTAGPRAPTLT